MKTYYKNLRILQFRSLLGAGFLIIAGAFTSVAQAQTSWTGGAGDSNFTTDANWSGNLAPGPTTAATINSTGTVININLSVSDSVGSLNTTGSGTINLNLNGNVLTLNPDGGLFFQPALFVNTGSTLSLSGTTGSAVNVTSGQIFVGDTSGNGTLNLSTSLNFDTTDSGNAYSYMVIGRNDDTNYNVSPVSPTIGHGTVNQTAGTVTTGGNLIIGVDSGTGTYNLSGGTLTTGSVGTFFPIYIGLNQTSAATSPTTGTLNITGTGTFNLGTGGALYVGTGLNSTSQGYTATVGGTGSIIQNGAGTSVTIGGDGAIFGDFNASGGTPGTGGMGTYELDAGTLNVTGNNFSFGNATGGTGYLIQTGGTLTTSTNTVLGASGSGTYNLSGGIATFNNGITLAANAGSIGTINLSGTAILQVGGTNGIAIGDGTAVLNGSGGTIQATSNLTTSVPINLSSNTRTTVDTGAFSVTLNGTVTDANNGTNGGLTKIGSGSLQLTGSNDSISSFYVVTGTVNQTQAGSQLTSYELSVGYNTTGANFAGSSNVANYNMSAGTLILAAGTPPGIVGGTGSSLRIGDFNGTGTFTQTGGLVEVDGSLDVGNRGGHGLYSISGTGTTTTELDLTDSLNILGRNDPSDGTSGNNANLGSSTGELEISGNSLVSLASGGELVLGSTQTTTVSSVALGSTGTIVQTGGTLLINNGANLYLSAVGSGEYDLNGGVLEVGGTGLKASYTSGGSYQFNLGGGTIQVTGSDLTTSVNANLTGNTTSIVDTNGFNATFTGTFTSTDGQLVKASLGNLALQNASDSITSLLIVGGNVNETSGSALTSYEIAVGTGLGNTGTYTMTGGTLTMAAGTPPGIVGGTASSLRIGDFGGTGTFTQSGGLVVDNGSLNIGNRGGNGLYAISGTGELDLGDTLNIIGRNAPADGAAGTFSDLGSTTGELDISGNSLVSLASNGSLILSSNSATTVPSVGQGSQGKIVQTGGTLQIGSGAGLYLAAVGTGEYDLDGGTLEIGGNSLHGVYNAMGGSYQFNLGGGTIQVINSSLTTNVAVTLTGSTSSTINTNGFDATFTGEINNDSLNNAQFVKVGSGNLEFDGASNTISSFYVNGGNFNQTGTVTITSYEVGVGSGTGNTGTYTMSGGSLIFPAGPVPPIVGGAGTFASFRIGDFGGTGTFIQTDGTVTVNGALDIGNQGGHGTYELSGGSLDLESGQSALGRTNGSSSSSTGTLDISGSGQLNVDGTYEFIGSNWYPTTGSPLGSGVINQTGGAITVASMATLYLTGNGVGTYNLDGGTLNIGGNSLVGNFGEENGSYQFNLGGGTIQVTGSDLITSVNASLTSGTQSFIDTNGLNATFSGNITGANGQLIKTGAGNLALTGTDTFASFGIEDGNVNQSTSTLTVNELMVGTGTGATGTYTMTGGSIIFPDGTPPPLVGGSASSFRVGDFGGTGEFDQSGGNIRVNGTVDIGNRGGDGVYNLSGGILDVGPIPGAPDTTSFILGRSRSGDADTTGTLNVSGTADLILEANTDLLIGGDTDNTDSGTGSGVVTQTGGTVTVNSVIQLGTTTNSSGTYNLDGGVLQVGGTNGISVGFGTYQFNLGGGTLQVIGSDLTTNLNASFTSGTTSTVDTNGRNATFSGTLGGSGALVKTNSGNLILTAANNYSGGTEVKGGALIVKNTSGSATGSGSLQVDTGATVGGSGRIVTTSFTINGTAQVGNGVGVDTTSNLTLANSAASFFTNATLQFNLGATSNDNNKLTIGSGSIAFDSSNITTVLLNINSMPAADTKNQYDLIDTGLGTGSYSGLTFGGLDSEGDEIITGGLVIGANSSFGTSVNGIVTIGPEAGSYLFLKGGEIGVMVIPEPNTWMMLLGGLVFLALLRFRCHREKK